MKPGAGAVLRLLLALGVLGVFFVVTGRALRRSGAWSHARQVAVPGLDPYSQLDRQLAGWQALPAPQLARDPAGYVASAAPRVARVARVPRAPEADTPPRPQPVLTAIVWDSDPTASIRIGGHDYTVRANSLFADYQVASISHDQVVLTRSGESLVLRLQSKGERE